MNRFDELLKSVSARPSVTVRLGAGTCSEFDSYMISESNQVIYVEPDQYLAKSASESFRHRKNVKVIAIGIATQNGLQTLNITNNRRYSSLLLPDKLLEFYPNIEVCEETEVMAVTLGQLCQDEHIRGDSKNLLVAELHGMEKEVFPSAEIETLQLFKWIIIRSSKTNLYQPSTKLSRKSVSKALQDAGFMVLTFLEDSPPFLNFLCIRNDAIIENSELKIKQDKLLGSIKALESDLSNKVASLEKTRASMLSEKAKLKETSKQLRESQNSMLSTKTKLKETSTQLRESQNSILSKKAKLKEISMQLKETSTQLRESQNLNESLEQEKENQQKKLSELHQTLRINNKLILKSDADLRDLQLQYRTLLQQHQQQHTLLSELKKKLRQASIYYQKLNLQNLHSENEILESDDTKSVESIRDNDIER